jgi:hypothetical protein
MRKGWLKQRPEGRGHAAARRPCSRQYQRVTRGLGEVGTAPHRCYRDMGPAAADAAEVFR